jgi:hypothetical protein
MHYSPPKKLPHATSTCASTSAANMFELVDVATTFTPTPDMVADFMTKETYRLTHELHCRRAFGNQHAPIPLEPIVHVLA